MKIYTLSQFVQAPAMVMEEINIAQNPALITSHGSPQFMITPIAPGEIESLAGTAMLAMGMLDDEAHGDAATTEELQAAINQFR